MLEALPGFVLRFAAALGVNLGIAASALTLGLLLGLPLAAARLAGGKAGQGSAVLVAVMRAAPTFVVMFFLVNVLPPQVALGPWHLGLDAWWAVVLALAVYTTAYVSDNALDALRQWRAGSHAGALLFLMSLARAFFVVVLSSGFGAAVGVIEATTVTLRELERLPSLGQQGALMALVMLFFVLVFQCIYALIDALRRRLLTALAPTLAEP